MKWSSLEKSNQNRELRRSDNGFVGMVAEELLNNHSQLHTPPPCQFHKVQWGSRTIERQVFTPELLRLARRNSNTDEKHDLYNRRDIGNSPGTDDDGSKKKRPRDHHGQALDAVQVARDQQTASSPAYPHIGSSYQPCNRGVKRNKSHSRGFCAENIFSDSTTFIGDSLLLVQTLDRTIQVAEAKSDAGSLASPSSPLPSGSSLNKPNLWEGRSVARLQHLGMPRSALQTVSEKGEDTATKWNNIFNCARAKLASKRAKVSQPTLYPYRARAVYDYEADPSYANKISLTENELLEIVDPS